MRQATNDELRDAIVKLAKGMASRPTRADEVERLREMAATVAASFDDAQPDPENTAFEKALNESLARWGTGGQFEFQFRQCWNKALDEAAAMKHKYNIGRSLKTCSAVSVSDILALKKKASDA